MSSANWLGSVFTDPPAVTASPTQLNGTGATVQLVPTILSFIDNPTPVALGNVDGGITVIYTSPTSVVAGTYWCHAVVNISSTAVSWSSNEQMAFSINTVAQTGIIASSTETFCQPYYISSSPGIGGNFSVACSGLVQLDATAFPRVTVMRLGTGLTGTRYGDVQSIIWQKIA